MKNKFDKLEFNIHELSNINFPVIKKKNILSKILLRYFYGILIYFNIFEKFVDSSFIRYSFNEFKEFWIKYLNGRPIFFHDFNYLLGSYRKKFQDIEIENEKDNKSFIEAWQTNKALYLLFGNVRKYSYRPLHSFKIERFIKNNFKILEYGCGIAPVSYSLLNFSFKKNLDITIADILQINFIYAKYRMSGMVKTMMLEPKMHNLKFDYYDVIICEAVMEHLPDPLETVKSIYKSLNQNGLFIFDYILSSGQGHDTIASLEKRNVVIDYLDTHFIMIEGKLSKNKSMSTTVLRKKI